MTRKARVGLVLSPEEKQMLIELAAAERLGISAMVRRLILLASQEVRSPSDQLRWMLRQELLCLGLPSDPFANTGQSAAPDHLVQDPRPLVLAAQSPMVESSGTKQSV